MNVGIKVGIKVLLSVLALAFISTSPAGAQTGRFYAGAVAGREDGSRGPIEGGSVSTAGGMLGVKIAGGWSVELEIDRGFRTLEHLDEGIWFITASVGPGRIDPAEAERFTVRARWVRTEQAGAGWSAHTVWRSRAPGRVNAAVFTGITSRKFTTRTLRTVTSVGPGVDLPPDDPRLHPADLRGEITGNGLSIGGMLPIRVAGPLTIAPEVRTTLGLITDESLYKVTRLAVRAMWRF